MFVGDVALPASSDCLKCARVECVFALVRDCLECALDSSGNAPVVGDEDWVLWGQRFGLGVPGAFAALNGSGVMGYRLGQGTARVHGDGLERGDKGEVKGWARGASG